MNDKESEFKGFEDAAFLGKLTTQLMGLTLKKLFGDKAELEYETKHGFVDCYIRKLGFIEITTAKKPAVKYRRKWYNISKDGKIYIIVPKRLIAEYRQK
ncbi:MAG: hypothetical protein DRO43_05650, partial [Candidatus Hecatellales archaeon]